MTFKLNKENKYILFMHNIMNKSNLTCVSGYWKIKHKIGDKFYDWFKHSFKIK